MELELGRGSRTDPWGIKEGRIPVPLATPCEERSVESAAWFNILVPDFPPCGFQCVRKKVPMGPADSLPGKWPLSLQALAPEIPSHKRRWLPLPHLSFHDTKH